MSSLVNISGFDPEGPFAGLILPPRFRERQKETRFKQKWKLTLQQYAAMMREFKGPRWQRGIVIATTVYSGAAGPSVVLTAHSATAISIDPNDATCQIRFDTDGGLTHIRTPGSDPTYSGQWWSDEPEASIGSSYEVRAVGSSAAWTVAAAADNIWITITGNRGWTINRSSPGVSNVNASFEVGLDGVESALDSATMTCIAIVEV